jgi:hypothetical protein
MVAFLHQEPGSEYRTLILLDYHRVSPLGGESVVDDPTFLEPC